ncbi:MAG: GNAT family N-acetyltransferase [Anaerolineales bacterium]|nr:GNAT family N-acetyltransferase [Anaerolineales bacterium]
MKPTTPEKVAHLFEPLDYQLAIGSVLAGLTPGYLYADNPSKPTIALLAYQNHLVFAGEPQNGDFNQALRNLILETIVPGYFDPDQGVFFIHTSSAVWHLHIDDILAGLHPVIRQRTYLECTHLVQDWRQLLSHDFTLCPVDRELLSQPHLENLDYLKEELCSERPTIEDFLEKSFGFCVLKGEKLASWCLSEYNTVDRCEVGVATVDDFQRQGLATITTLALLDHAFAHSYKRIGWHCWKNNTPSVALALRAGFSKVHDYSIHLCALDLAIQFALNGDDHRSLGAYQEAKRWYERAISLDTAPGWVFYNTARCLALMGENQQAIDYLHKAVQRGFDDLDRIHTEADLIPLHSHPAWGSLFP